MTTLAGSAPPAGNLPVSDSAIAADGSVARPGQVFWGARPRPQPTPRSAQEAGRRNPLWVRGPASRKRQRGVTLMELLVAMTLLSLLAIAVLFGFRIGLNAMERSNARVIANRRVLGVERIITQQIAGFMPVKADCFSSPQSPPARLPFFQGEAQTMRFVSSYSLDEASRGYPRILEFQVVPGKDGEGVRLVVNEFWYTGPLSAGGACAGVINDPAAGAPRMIFRPVQVGPTSFVLADKLAQCVFFFKEERQPPQSDIWVQRWIRPRAPNAIRIEMTPLSTDPSRLEVPPIVAPVRITRDPMMQYTDWQQQ
jgi:prepilin-type N-terminal cleavage/methylation domain-containing protein